MMHQLSGVAPQIRLQQQSRFCHHFLYFFKLSARCGPSSFICVCFPFEFGTCSPNTSNVHSREPVVSEHNFRSTQLQQMQLTIIHHDHTPNCLIRFKSFCWIYHIGLQCLLMKEISFLFPYYLIGTTIVAAKKFFSQHHAVQQAGDQNEIMSHPIRVLCDVDRPVVAIERW
jgi:hypothetical protein